MSFAAPREDWLSVAPFWRHLPGDVPVVTYDVPFTVNVEPFNGLEISGWATHDKLAPTDAYPAELLPEIRRRFGEWHIGPEHYGPSAVDELIGLGERLRDSTERSADLTLWLLERPWRLAIAAFSTLHRGGHRLFDRSSIAGPLSDVQGEQFDRSLRDLYVACDAAVGRLVAAAPDATVVAFSAHGMMANTTRVDLLDDMLARVLTGRSNTRAQRGRLRRVVEVFPLTWRRAATARVPRAFRDRLMTMWSAGGIAWERTPAFTLKADLQGYVRINLRGREQRGIVAPGAAWEELCTRITEGLLSFRDAETGEPFVAAVERIERVYPDGDRRDRLPDLVVLWSDAPAGSHVAVDSPQFGRVGRSTPGRIPNGRSGNHRGEGFIIASGPGIPEARRLGSGIGVIDLAPTVVRLLSAHAAVPLAGRPIPELVGAA